MPTYNTTTSVRVAKNTAYLYVKLIISLCFTLFTTRIVLGSLGASDYGIWGVLGSTIAMLGFLSASMATTTQRFMNYYEGKGDVKEKLKIFNSAVLIHVAIAVFVGVLFIGFEELMFDVLIKVEQERLIAAKWVYRITVLSTIISIVTVPYEAAINSHENMLYYSIVGIIDLVLKFLLALYVSITPFDKLVVYGITVLSVTILTFFLMYIYCRRKYLECVFRPVLYFDRFLIKEMFFFGGWSLVGTSSTMISNYGLGIIINRFFGTVINATHSVCTQFTGFLQVLSTNLMKAVNPVIVKNEGKGDRKKMFEATFFSCKLSFLAYLFIGIPFFIECNYILHVWLTEVPPFCLEFCQLACVLKVVEQLTVPLNTSITAVGKIKQYNIVIATIQISQIALVIVFFSNGFAPFFCVVAMIVAVIISSMYKIMFCYKKLAMDLVAFARIIMRCSMHLVLCMIPAIFLYFMQESYLRLLLVVVSSFLLNTLVGYIVVFNGDEKKVLLDLVRKMIKRIPAKA